MKNGKRIAAVAAVILILAVFCLPMYFALRGEAFDRGLFFAALAAAFFVPIMLYIILESIRIFGKRKGKEETAKSSEARVDNIIFDVGQVLVKFDWQALMDSFGFEKEKREKIEAAIFGSHIWDERDRGLYPEEEYVNRMVAEAPEYESEIREFMRRTPETISKTDYALTWVKYLKKQGYHLYVLSNYCQYMLDANMPQMDFLKYMDGVVFSCKVNELKPEEGIYRKLLDTWNLDPARSVFLDDRRENLDGAKKLGIHTILFQNFKQAAAELERKYGVK
jgi:putative hydrolase of the HAD superfamily